MLPLCALMRFQDFGESQIKVGQSQYGQCLAPRTTSDRTAAHATNSRDLLSSVSGTAMMTGLALRKWCSGT